MLSHDTLYFLPRTSALNRVQHGRDTGHMQPLSVSTRLAPILFLTREKSTLVFLPLSYACSKTRTRHCRISLSYNPFGLHSEWTPQSNHPQSHHTAGGLARRDKEIPSHLPRVLMTLKAPEGFAHTHTHTHTLFS